MPGISSVSPSRGHIVFGTAKGAFSASALLQLVWRCADGCGYHERLDYGMLNSTFMELLLSRSICLMVTWVHPISDKNPCTVIFRAFHLQGMFEVSTSFLLPCCRLMVTMHGGSNFKFQTFLGQISRVDPLFIIGKRSVQTCPGRPVAPCPP